MELFQYLKLKWRFATRVRTDLKLSVWKEKCYFHRLVAIVYGNTPGLYWETFHNTPHSDGPRTRMWEADHRDGNSALTFHYSMEVVTRGENRRRHEERIANKEAAR